MKEQAYRECHVYRHWWKPTTVDTDHPDYYIQHMQCQRCTMERRWRVSRTTGEPIGNNYTAPEGYYYHRDDDGEELTAAELRSQLRINEIESHIIKARPKRVRKSK